MGAMNELNVNLQHSILTLAGNGWSNRRIARELGINRETVGKYLLLVRSKPASSTLGSESDSDPKPAISTTGSAAGRQSLCQPHLPVIEAAVGVGLGSGVGKGAPGGWVASGGRVRWLARGAAEKGRLPGAALLVSRRARSELDEASPSCRSSGSGQASDRQQKAEESGCAQCAHSRL